jgi:hypothetical protein
MGIKNHLQRKSVIFEKKEVKMRGINFITNGKNEKIAVQIDLKRLEESQGEVEELLDVIIAESRKDDEEISWEDLKKQLKADGKL